MNEVLRERMLRKLETLPDERVYQVLDYVEFLESKYAVRAPAASVFQRFAESVEDTMRAGRVSAATIAETMNLMSRAMGVLSGALAAGRSVATDVMTAATRPAVPPPAPSPSSPAPAPPQPSASAQPPAASQPSEPPAPPPPPPSGEAVP